MITFPNFESAMNSDDFGDEITADQAPSSDEMWSFLQQSSIRPDEEPFLTPFGRLKDDRVYADDHHGRTNNTKKQPQDMPMVCDEVLSSFLEVPPLTFRSTLSTSYSVPVAGLNTMRSEELMPNSREVAQTMRTDNKIPPVPSSRDHGQERDKEDRPTFDEVAGFVTESHFEDGVEHTRNFIVDHTTNRSYVYTTDMDARMLPEILFLDVPNSPHAARICGQWIAENLAVELEDAITKIYKDGRKERKANATKILHELINEADYDVKNVFVPGPDQGTVQSVSLRFRMRLLAPTTKLYKMLRSNFFGDRYCTQGLLVVIPFMEVGSAADTFWGCHSVEIRLQPDRFGHVSNQMKDNWCKKIADCAGAFRGRSQDDAWDGGESWARLATSPEKVRKLSPTKPKEPKNILIGTTVSYGGDVNETVTASAAAKSGAKKQMTAVETSSVAAGRVKQLATASGGSSGGVKKHNNVHKNAAKTRGVPGCEEAISVSKSKPISPKSTHEKAAPKSKAKVVKKVVTKKPTKKVRLERLKEAFRNGKKTT